MRQLLKAAATSACDVRTLSDVEVSLVGGGVLPGVGVCKADPKPENSAFGYAMLALAIILL